MVPAFRLLHIRIAPLPELGLLTGKACRLKGASWIRKCSAIVEALDFFCWVSLSDC